MSRIRTLLVAAVFMLVATSASAQWSTWSPGSPCLPSGIVPALVGTGPMASPSGNALIFCDGVPGATCFLVVGFGSLRSPFMGGTFGPTPDIILPLFTDAAGKSVLQFDFPVGVPAGTMLWWQVWCPQSPPPGLCSSNTLKSTST